MKKRILSLFLAVVMLVLAIPAMALTAFAADEAAGATASVSTTFGAGSSALPVYKDADDNQITTAFDFVGGWQFGSLPLNKTTPASLAELSLGTTLTPYTGQFRTSDTIAYYYSNRNNGWNESSASYKNGGAIAFQKATGKPLMCPGVWMNNNVVASYGAAATVRYTAQFTGDVTFTVAGDWMYEQTEGYAHLFIAINGTKTYDIVQGADAVSETYKFKLTAGDTLDVSAVIDPTYTYTDATGKSAANRPRIARSAVANKIGRRGIRIASVIMRELDDGGRRSHKDCACDRHCCDRK